MPKIKVEIEWDTPDDPYWLNPDNLVSVLNKHTGIKGLKVKWAEGGNPWKKEEVKEITKPKTPIRRVEPNMEE